MPVSLEANTSSSPDSSVKCNDGLTGGSLCTWLQILVTGFQMAGGDKCIIKNILPFLKICWNLLLGETSARTCSSCVVGVSKAWGLPSLSLCVVTLSTGREDMGTSALFPQKQAWRVGDRVRHLGNSREGGRTWGRARFTGAFQIVWCGDRLGMGALPQGHSGTAWYLQHCCPSAVITSFSVSWVKLVSIRKTHRGNYPACHPASSSRVCFSFCSFVQSKR